ncbi:hypothetical protein BCR22_07215 [Enterococcus plantarum]|uniref:helix-turn-helix domain-containing protein n=1 Tax=Enterococcus plantarum TaxID=1077675 RepID=UPI00084D3B61|nr:helix-turn-helix domain-containing protein [Enterococcus plantarum]OEG09375.1 hypothetical protein BCR22_07215 [Enterococcus plantarum]
MQNQKSYFAIIPAIVRYDNDLNGNAKLLYGELTALANEKGYCWATNLYFANLYGVSKRTIISWMKQLEKKKYINIRVFYKPNSKQVERRHIYILPFPTESDFYEPSEENFITYGKNQHEGSEENFTTPSEENFTDNNTVINNTVNNTLDKKNSVEQSSTVSDSFEEIWKKFPKKTNKKKAKEQFIKKIKTEDDLEQFNKGYADYLKYIELNEWYHPQELFRWIRDDRFNDEYDLKPPKPTGTYQRQPIREETMPESVTNPTPEAKLSPEEQAALDAQIAAWEASKK